jgi:hypothetical protein
VKADGAELALIVEAVARIRQHVYFAVRSGTVTADEVTQRVGIEPDGVDVRGARSHTPARPAAHSWKVVCEQRGLTVDEQIEAVVSRLRGAEEKLARLCSDPACACVLQVVRYLDADDGEPEQLSDPDATCQKLPGQHQLLGWHLDVETLAFLTRIGAPIDVDEYG